MGYSGVQVVVPKPDEDAERIRTILEVYLSTPLSISRTHSPLTELCVLIYQRLLSLTSAFHHSSAPLRVRELGRNPRE